MSGRSSSVLLVGWWSLRVQLVAMLRVILQGLVHCLHDRARGDGRAGPVVERSAVLPDLPFAVLAVLQRGAVEAGDPAAPRDLDVIAQPRCLFVRHHAHAADAAGAVDGDDQ